MGHHRGARRVSAAVTIAAAGALAAATLVASPGARAGASEAARSAGTAAASEIVGYGSSGWRYKVVPTGTGAGFEAGPEPPGFTSGRAAFGTTGSLCTYNVRTAWPLNTDILVRRRINFPDGATDVQIGLAIDNDALVYWNGELVGSQVHEFCATRDSLVVPIDDADVLVGANLLAVRGTDRGDLSLLDIRVSASLVGPCSLDGSTLRLRIPVDGNVTVGRSGMFFDVSGDGITDPDCGGATVNNVDRIEVLGSTGAEHLTLDFSGGAFAPGLTSEGTGISEIEVSYDGSSHGDAEDRLFVQGGAGNDTFTVGASGMNLNGDDDGDDLTLAGVETVLLDGGDGKDILSGAGGLGTGGPYALNLFLFGAAGNDTLTGGTSFDIAEGGSGNDRFNALKTADGPDLYAGGTGTDTMVYSKRAGRVEVRLDDVSLDGSPDEGDNVNADIENVTTGKGNDLISDGGRMVKNTFKSGLGNDTIEADDGIGGNDTADGGDGTDTCTTDAGDTKLNCET